LTLAITRGVSPALARCELTHLPRESIDLSRAEAQHRAYEECLEALGCSVVRLPAEPDLPDSVFVEDAAVVLDELAVITRPGAASRRAETVAVAEALRPHRRLARIEPPGTLDGGDVLRVGRTLFVGLSSRSNESGVERLRAEVRPFGYTVTAVAVRGCLHLKSAVTQVDVDTLLINPDWVNGRLFGEVRLVGVDPSEPFGANALRVGRSIVYSEAHARTRDRLEARGIDVRAVDVTELAKAEGGVTCCSLIIQN
jgi:dimethylargininase